MTGLAVRATVDNWIACTLPAVAVTTLINQRLNSTIDLVLSHPNLDKCGCQPIEDTFRDLNGILNGIQLGFRLLRAQRDNDIRCADQTSRKACIFENR